MTETTQEQKIDYIFERLKKQEKSEKIALCLKWGFRIFIIFYLYYFITVGLPAMMSNLIPSMPRFGGENSEPQVSKDQIQNLISDYFSK